MSSRNAVEFGDGVVVKRFADPERYQAELACYRRVPWAAPRLLESGDTEIVIEALVPAIEAPEWRPLGELRRLLERIHEAGVNHRDVHIHNIVRGHDGEPLLVDWEWATMEVGPASYDLHGSEGSGVHMPAGMKGEPMWVGARHKLSVGIRWGA